MKFCVVLLFLLAMTPDLKSQNAGWQIIEVAEKKQIDVRYNGKLMTSYCYYDSVMKPILYPIITTSGVTITRGFPIAPREGDHVDHPHHTGLWLNYEYVNGFDFWNNSPAIPSDKRKTYGKIVHTKVVSSHANDKDAVLETDSEWWTMTGVLELKEHTTYRFQRTASEFIIDRTTSLTAAGKEVLFNDVKDGFLGLRVASELEMPSKTPLEFLDAHGNITKVESNGAAATGMYTSSAGLQGDAVWGTRGTWCTLQGKKDGHDISITILDHPSNVGYPTYWHARGYGLFAANPLGQNVFSQGREKLNFKLAAHATTTFKYRIVVASDEMPSAARIKELVAQFANSKD